MCLTSFKTYWSDWRHCKNSQQSSQDSHYSSEKHPDMVLLRKEKRYERSDNKSGGNDWQIVSRWGTPPAKGENARVTLSYVRKVKFFT